MTPIQIKALRNSHSLTQTQAAKLVWMSCRAWQQFEAGDRRMSKTIWELFLRKLDNCPHCRNNYI